MVIANRNCRGTPNGTVSYDVCGQCTGGTTGKTPKTIFPNETMLVTGIDDGKQSKLKDKGVGDKLFVSRNNMAPLVFNIRPKYWQALPTEHMNYKPK